MSTRLFFHFKVPFYVHFIHTFLATFIFFFRYMLNRRPPEQLLLGNVSAMFQQCFSNDSATSSAVLQQKMESVKCSDINSIMFNQREAIFIHVNKLAYTLDQRAPPTLVGIERKKVRCKVGGTRWSLYTKIYFQVQKFSFT